MNKGNASHGVKWLSSSAFHVKFKKKIFFHFNYYWFYKKDVDIGLGKFIWSNQLKKKKSLIHYIMDFTNEGFNSGHVSSAFKKKNHCYECD